MWSIMDNLGSHKGEALRQAIRSAGAIAVLASKTRAISSRSSKSSQVQASLAPSGGANDLETGVTGIGEMVDANSRQTTLRRPPAGSRGHISRKPSSTQSARHARAYRSVSTRRRERLRHWVGAIQAWRERRRSRARRADVCEGMERSAVAAVEDRGRRDQRSRLHVACAHSRLVCRARIVSDVSPKRGRSLRIASSKAIICAVSNSEPIGKTESLPP